MKRLYIGLVLTIAVASTITILTMATAFVESGGQNRFSEPLHIKGNSNWGVIVQNNEPVWHESGLLIREPDNDNGNRFSVIVGSGFNSGVELFAGRDESRTPLNINIDSGAWKWIYGNGVRIMFEKNGVACFGPASDCSNGKQVEIRASSKEWDTLKIIGIKDQEGALIRILEAGGSEAFSVYSTFTYVGGEVLISRDIKKPGQSKGVFERLDAIETELQKR